MRTRTPSRGHLQATKSANEIRDGRPMPVDFTQPVWDADRFPGRNVASVGAQAGAQELGASVYELDPGVVGAPLHVHHANEELLLVLAGTLSLRGPDGTQLLSAGAVVAFPRGQAGAHSLVNRSDAPVRYLVVSTTHRPDVVEYPDTGATLVVLAEQRLAYPPGADADQSPSSPKRCGRRPNETPDRQAPQTPPCRCPARRLSKRPPARAGQTDPLCLRDARLRPAAAFPG